MEPGVDAKGCKWWPMWAKTGHYRLRVPEDIYRKVDHYPGNAVGWSSVFRVIRWWVGDRPEVRQSSEGDGVLKGLSFSNSEWSTVPSMFSLSPFVRGAGNRGTEAASRRGPEAPPSLLNGGGISKGQSFITQFIGCYTKASLGAPVTQFLGVAGEWDAIDILEEVLEG
ncbi:uncharacterized protein EI90DRAFT_3017957 [Cantharellus anzutake]|uniref:uncharacterized protein n=1 Tax=Cantharellus anzutake TaxID=1750568 RepID=UPI001905D030|nr:uncharacterized protein EI90DRAFT_3017957 [Cantharellus anzutake]KAF8327975.1 hypothetical protein EI90DRAFT_3017957 [Cantharellus anzutake]